MRGLTIAFVVLLLPTMALAQTTTTQPPAPPLAETVPMPTPPVADMTFRRVAAISVGAVAGMIILNFVTGGMITPILSAGVVDVAPAATVPATAAAAAAVPAAAMAGVDYVATATQTAVTAIGAIAGGLVGNWLYAR